MFGGETYDPVLDKERLTKQKARVFSLMEDGEWRTLGEIARETGDPEASVSARLRDFRKRKFGAFIVERQRRGNVKHGHYEYRVTPSEGQD
jgi:hypothetical protein